MSGQRVGDHGPVTFAGRSNTDSTNKPTWYIDTIESIPDEGRQLLEEYSKVAPSEVLPHVTRVRDRAFSLWAYACIGQVRFLHYSLPQLPYYEAVLSKLRQGARFLDAGCCFGQELRFLHHNDQVPARQLYGFDLEPAFVDFGYELFRDRGQFAATLLSGNLLVNNTAPTELDALDDRMDVVYVASVLHLWGWDDMVQAAKRLVRFTRPQAGSMIVGKQMGSVNAGEYPMPTGKGFNYRHNDVSIQQFWKQVGEETQTEWRVSSAMYVTQAVTDNMNASFADPGMRMIWFKAERVAA